MKLTENQQEALVMLIILIIIALLGITLYVINTYLLT